MTNMETELNKLCKEVIWEVEKDLNKWSFNISREQTPIGYCYPEITSLGNCTIAKTNVDAFTLEDPVAGLIKDKFVPNLGDTIVIRRVYGYSAASRLLESQDPTRIKPFLKEMVLTLIKERGFTPEKLNAGIYGTFQRPGSGKAEFFREMSTHAGFELRLYSSTTLAENIK